MENRQYVPTPPSFNALAPGDPRSNFGMNLISTETRVIGLPYGEETMIIGRSMWIQSTSVTDGRTDRQNYDHKDRAMHSVARSL